MWKAPVQGFASTRQATIFAWDAVGQSQKSQIGCFYQIVKSNK
ncbi:hypothetical protein UFOVP230_7 [uncultured Caudovirales phage]|uniref:Uncharacterized protein n=1 Tax=uncultured Caudovirales phage TaxID=2100421 RepID=A0A6J7XQP0_9CAUD|nr:hypothetical protein UFOVP230_7 [uncultured Caudovirales phage]